MQLVVQHMKMQKFSQHRIGTSISPFGKFFAKTQQVLHHQSQHPIFMKLRHIIPNIAVTEPVTNQQPKFTINTNLKTCQSLAAYTYQSLAEFFTQTSLAKY
jgi:hypothetical protein